MGEGSDVLRGRESERGREKGEGGLGGEKGEVGRGRGEKGGSMSWCCSVAGYKCGI